MSRPFFLTISIVLFGCGGATAEPATAETAAILVPEDQAGGLQGTEVEQAQPSERDVAVDAAAAARRERCAAMTAVPGLPPEPPAASASPELQAAQAVYEASLAPAFEQPAENTVAAINPWAQSVLADWAQEHAGRLSVLESAVSELPDADKAQGRLWLAHAVAVFVERFHQTPVPVEVGDDADLREIYTNAINDKSESLLGRAQRALEHVDSSPYRSALEGWLQQEACAYR